MGATKSAGRRARRGISRRRVRGWTLIELLVVVAIIVGLAAIAIPAFISARRIMLSKIQGPDPIRAGQTTEYAIQYGQFARGDIADGRITDAANPTSTPVGAAVTVTVSSTQGSVRIVSLEWTQGGGPSTIGSLGTGTEVSGSNGTSFSGQTGTEGRLKLKVTPDLVGQFKISVTVTEGGKTSTAERLITVQQ